jgi:hypothetical protein
MFRGAVEIRLSQRKVADMLGLSVAALQARVFRFRQSSPGARELPRDGFRFVKAGSRWFAYVSPPWVNHGAPRRWCSLEKAARALGVEPDTLRRRLRRSAVRDAHGTLVARLHGYVACKFGDTWRISRDATDGGLG